MGSGAVFPQGFGRGKDPVINDGLVVVLNDDMLQLVPFSVLTIDLLAGIFALAEGADIKIVVDDALDGNNGPGPLGRTLTLLSRRSRSAMRGVGTFWSVRWFAIFL